MVGLQNIEHDPEKPARGKNLPLPHAGKCALQPSNYFCQQSRGQLDCSQLDAVK